MDWRLTRIARGAFTIFLVINLSFFFTQMLPGGPEDYLRERLQRQGMSEDVIMRIVNTYTNIRPDKPLSQQYIDYMNQVILQQNLGQSIWYDEPVTRTLGQALPWTVFLFSLATWVSFPLGIVLGALMAYKEGSKFDLTLTSYEMIAGSIPYYIIGILLVFYFGFILGLFPWQGKVNWDYPAGFNIDFMGSVLYHATLPAMSMILVRGASLSMRGNSIRVLGSDYVRVARLRGVPDSFVVTRYVARNAILPIYTGFMAGIAQFFGGSVIIEMIFNYKGVGYYLFQAIEARDWPLMMGGFIMLTTITIIGIVTAELTYGYIDPRAREGGEGVETY